MSNLKVGNLTYSGFSTYSYLGIEVKDSSKLKEALEQFNITPTGTTLDLTRLNDKLYTEYSAQVKEQINNQNPKSEVPWASLCAQIGVEVTGDYQKDYEAFSQAISLFKQSAIDGQQMAYVAGLENEAQRVFVNNNSNGNQQPAITFDVFKAQFLT